jgi:choline dehydrogenase-like flavoprotein
MVFESMQSQGLSLDPDMFSTGATSHGCGHAPRTVYQGDRTTAANYLLNKGTNLSIKTDTIVDKVILHGEGSDMQASAVKIIEKDGTTREIKAKKEIIVSGGAYCSPTILLRSGIGPKSELASHGIRCNVDLPGVGKNLMDHLVSFQFACQGLPSDQYYRSCSSSTQLPNPILRTIISFTNPTLLEKHIASGKRKNGVRYRRFRSELLHTPASMSV